MAKRYPKEFRDDVVRVARGRPPGVTLEQIGKDFRVHPITVSNWLRKARIEDGEQPGTTSAANDELVEARWRIRLLEQENEVLRRAAAYLGQANLPKDDVPVGAGTRRGKDHGHGLVPGPWAVRPALLPLADCTGV